MLRQLTDEQWKKDQLTILQYATLADQMINTHHDIMRNYGNPIQNPKSIPSIETLLTLFHQALRRLNKYARESNPSNQIVIVETNSRQYDIMLGIRAVVDRIIQLNAILSGKYLYASQKATSLYSTKENIQKSYDGIQTALKFRQENTTVLPEDYDPGLQESVRVISEHYTRYYPDESLPKNKIDELLAQARNAKNHDLAFDKFQEAIDSAKADNNDSMQFKIACEQNDIYSRVILNYQYSNKLADLDLRKKHINKSCSPLLFAAELKMSKPLHDIENQRCTSIPFTLFRSAEILLSLANEKRLKNDLARKSALLADAKSYQDCAERFSVNINADFPAFKSLGKKILDQMTIVDSKMDKLKQAKLIKEKKKADLLIDKNEYDQKFPELLESIKKMDKPRIVKTKTRSSCYNMYFNNNNDSESSSEDEPDINETVDNPSIPPYKFKYKEVEIIDLLKKNIELLQLAELNHNRPLQADLAVAISDYHRIHASRLMKKLDDHVDEIIIHLQSAIYYLQYILNIIKELDNGVEVEEWTGILLKHTEGLLAETLDHQKEIEKRFEAGRESAKAYVIEKYGRGAWYRNDASLLSLNAQILDQTKRRVEVLEDMQESIVEAYDYLKDQKGVTAVVSATSTTIINKSLNVQSKCDEAKSAEQINEKEQSDDKSAAKNNFNNAASQHSFFATMEEILTRPRSKSCDSYLAAEQFFERENNRKAKC